MADGGKVVYPELSFQTVGIAFKIFNQEGFGMPEKYYQELFAKELEKAKVLYEREKFIKLLYEDQDIGRYFLDFVLESKLVVELKVRPRFGYVHINQTLKYLKSGNYRLAILIYFTKDGVKYRRILNVT